LTHHVLQLLQTALPDAGYALSPQSPFVLTVTTEVNGAGRDVAIAAGATGHEGQPGDAPVPARAKFQRPLR
jgi:hypothetical protein